MKGGDVKMKGRKGLGIFAIAVIIALSVILCVQSSASASQNFGWLEVVHYEPNGSITLRLVIENPLNQTIHIIEPVAIPVPWGTDLIYGNITYNTLYPTVCPNASEGDALTGGLGPFIEVEFDFDRFLEPGERAEELLKLKINDWKGHSPSGITKYTFPYQLWMQTEEDTFFHYPIVTIEGIITPTFCTKPGTFASYDKFGVVDLTPDIINNRYGIFPDVNLLQPGKSQNITVTIWSGNGTEVKNATVNLSGCGVFISDSTYPYEFKGVNPTSIGKIKITAQWVENNITMNAIDFVPVSPIPNEPSSFSAIHHSMPITEKTVNISANVTDSEGIDMVLVKYWEDSKPWKYYRRMKKGDNNVYSTSIYLPWQWDGETIKYQIVCIDTTGNITESKINQFTVTPYGVSLTVDKTKKSTTPNVNATYLITVENIGTRTDNYTLVIDNPMNASVAELNKKSVRLLPGANETVMLNVTDEKLGTYMVNVTAISEGDPNKFDHINTTTVVTTEVRYDFDTGGGGYPSIMGIHNGTITPSHNIIANRLYTYPCEGTGGHSEYVRIWNSSWSVSGTWEGYGGDWHNITFNETFILYEGKTYNYTIRTGSY
ncbi:hypothetical protein DRO02_08120, partial [archaeon]